MEKTVSCRLVSCDWDGTLINSMPHKTGAIVETVSRYFDLDPEPLLAVFLNQVGIPRFQIFTAMAEQIGGISPTPEQLVELSRIYTELNLDGLTSDLLWPETEPGLQDLKKRGFRLFVSSASPPEELTLMVERCGLTGYFDGVLGSNPAAGKGAGHMALMKQQVGIGPESILHFGDDFADIRLAKEAGAFAGGKLSPRTAEEMTAQGADVTAANLLELTGKVELA